MGVDIIGQVFDVVDEHIVGRRGSESGNSALGFKLIEASISLCQALNFYSLVSTSSREVKSIDCSARVSVESAEVEGVELVRVSIGAVVTRAGGLRTAVIGAAGLGTSSIITSCLGVVDLSGAEDVSSEDAFSTVE